MKIGEREKQEKRKNCERKPDRRKVRDITSLKIFFFPFSRPLLIAKINQKVGWMEMSGGGGEDCYDDIPERPPDCDSLTPLSLFFKLFPSTPCGEVTCPAPLRGKKRSLYVSLPFIQTFSSDCMPRIFEDGLGTIYPNHQIFFFPPIFFFFGEGVGKGNPKNVGRAKKKIRPMCEAEMEEGKKYDAGTVDLELNGGFG